MIRPQHIWLVSIFLSVVLSPALSAQPVDYEPSYELPEYDALDLRGRNRPSISDSVLQRSQRYPESARNQGLEGRVVIGVLVDTNGSVLRTRIEMGSHRILEQTTERTVRTLTFRPARMMGQRVRAWISIPFDYKVDDFPRVGKQ